MTPGDGSNLVAKEWKWDKDAVDKNKGDAGQGMEKKKETDKHPLRISNTTSGNKYMMKPISELDLTECKQCTPSYRLLPENVCSLKNEFVLTYAISNALAVINIDLKVNTCSIQYLRSAVGQL